MSSFSKPVVILTSLRKSLFFAIFCICLCNFLFFFLEKSVHAKESTRTTLVDSFIYMRSSILMKSRYYSASAANNKLPKIPALSSKPGATMYCSRSGTCT